MTKRLGKVVEIEIKEVKDQDWIYFQCSECLQFVKDCSTCGGRVYIHKNKQACHRFVKSFN